MTLVTGSGGNDQLRDPEQH